MIYAGTEFKRFEDDLSQAVMSLRRSIVNLVVAMGADPTSPQEMSRRFGLDKSMTWKMSKLIRADRLLAAVPHVPGGMGIRIICDSLRAAGAPEQLLEDLDHARSEFERVVEVHAGDRGTLELMADSTAFSEAVEKLEQSRKLAFQGNIGIWGIRARIRTNTVVLTPTPGNPEQAEMAVVGGMVDCCRLRGNSRWPLFRLRPHIKDGQPIPPAMRARPLTPGSGDAWILSSFCSSPLPTIRRNDDGRALTLELGEGPVGKTGSFTFFFGTSVAGLPLYRDQEYLWSDHSASILTPVETLIFDVFVHRDLPLAAPGLAVFAGITPDPNRPNDLNPADRLPVGERVVSLGQLPGSAHTPESAIYGDLVKWIFTLRGWAPNDFRGYRVEMKYPAMPSNVVMRFPLPER